MPANFTGSLAISGSLLLTGSITTTGGITISGSIDSASFAATASSADNFVVRQNLTGSNVLATGTITAQTLVVQTVTSSIVYTSGSNIFGNLSTDVQQMTGSLRVTGSGNHYIVGGNVGIGITTPRSLVEIQKVSGNTCIGATSNATLTLSQAGAINEISQIGLGYTLLSSPAVVGYITTNAADYTNGSLIFATRNVTTDTAPTERMRITSAGNVGIGTCTPCSILHIQGAAGSTKLTMLPPSGQPNIIEFLTNAGAVDARIKNESTQLQFETGTSGVPRMIFTSTGIACFACSVYAPNGIFSADFVQNETSKVGISFASGYAQINSWGANTTTYGGIKLQLSVSNGGTFNALTIAPTGAATFSSSVTAAGTLKGGGTNYLINTSTGTDPVYQRILTTGGDVIFGIASSTGTSLLPGVGNYATVLYNNTNTDISFGTNQLLRMTITSGGNVGIGTANPGYRLHSVVCNNTAAASAVIYGCYYGGIVATGQTSSTYYGFKVMNAANGDTSVGNDLFIVRADGLIYTGTAALSPYNYGVSGVALYVASSGAIGYTTSTRESKSNISNIDNVNWIHSLQPVTFNKKKKDNEGNYTEELEPELQYGLIAEDVENVNSNFVFYNNEGKLAGVHYDRLVTPLLKAIQEQQCQICTQSTIIDQLKICLGII